jgi:hypothetical protein
MMQNQNMPVLAVLIKRIRLTINFEEGLWKNAKNLQVQIESIKKCTNSI